MHPRSRIERYVVDGLPAAAEQALRAHLEVCAPCRACYDEQRLLQRALAGDTRTPTAHETSQLQRRIVDAVFPRPPAAPSLRQRLEALVDRLLWTPPRSFIAVGGAVAVLLLLLLRVPGGSSPAATVLHARGASVAGVALVDGAVVEGLQVLELTKGGAVELELQRGGQLRVFGGTRLALGPRGESVVVERGKVWCLPAEGRGSFEVSTATATVRVLGTSFIVEASDERTDVRVVSGRVEVTDTDERGRVTLGRDEGTRVDRGQGPSPARKSSAAGDTREWQRFFDELFRNLRDGVETFKRGLKRGGTR